MRPGRYYSVTYRPSIYYNARENTVRAEFLGVTEPGTKYERLRLVQGKRYMLIPRALVVSIRRRRDGEGVAA